MPTLYFAGDTNVFGDMALIRRIYAPDVAVLPIGDHFTMGPREAAVAAELVGAARVVPSHYGHVPAADRHARGAAQRCCPPGSSSSRPRRARRSTVTRERWFGATGRKVPELALAGTVDVDGRARARRRRRRRALHAAHASGVPVVVRARDRRAGVHAALARPEVACVLVTTRPARLDLADLTYG